MIIQDCFRQLWSNEQSRYISLTIPISQKIKRLISTEPALTQWSKLLRRGDSVEPDIVSRYIQRVFCPNNLAIIGQSNRITHICRYCLSRHTDDRGGPQWGALHWPTGDWFWWNGFLKDLVLRGSTRRPKSGQRCQALAATLLVSGHHRSGRAKCGWNRNEEERLREE